VVRGFAAGSEIGLAGEAPGAPRFGVCGEGRAGGEAGEPRSKKPSGHWAHDTVARERRPGEAQPLLKLKNYGSELHFPYSEG